MRQAEIERLNVLRAKKANGTELNEKELARLAQLEKLQKEESIKNEGKTDNVQPGGTGRGTANNSDGAKGNNSNSGAGDSSASGEGLGKGKGAQRGKRQQSNTDSANDGKGSRGASGQADGVAGADTNGVGFGGDNVGSNGLEVRGIVFEGSNDGDDSRADKEEVISQGFNQVGSPKAVKPKVNSKKKPTGKEVTQADVFAGILQAGFGTIAMASGRRHWEIEEAEAVAVAEPLSKMLDGMSSANKKKLEKLMNPLSLGMAVAGIVVPRVMIDISMMKGARKNAGTINAVTRQAQPIGVGDIVTDTPIRTVQTSGGDSVTPKSNAPVVDSEIAGILNAGNM